MIRLANVDWLALPPRERYALARPCMRSGDVLGFADPSRVSRLSR